MKATWACRAAFRSPSVPARLDSSGGLQAVDYFLWALQRLYEQDEDRYWETIRSPSEGRLRHGRQTRTTSYGVYYTPAKPLTWPSAQKNSQRI